MNAIVKPINQHYIPRNERTLEDVEREIKNVMTSSFVDLGREFKRIKDDELWRNADVEYGSFTWYCEKRWGLGRAYIYRLINACEAYDLLSPTGDNLPTHEKQIRPLTRLKNDDDVIEAWNRAVLAAGDSAPTEQLVKDVVKQMFDERKDKVVDAEPEPLTLDGGADGTGAPEFIKINQWADLPQDERERYLSGVDTGKVFNKQKTDSIEWAQWSWNPITGCKHDCPYCYARDIAERFYKQGFEPAFLPDRLKAPANTKVPAEAANDIAFKNVFTCSMADLFGRWVPAEWIEAVLNQVRVNPQWNFLFLTKFPKRMAEFDIPKNAWMGTSVDCQARVKNAERAFEKVNCDVKWLSVEPLIEPLTFNSLDMFQWVVIGGASSSNRTPAFVPSMDAIASLHQQARQSGCSIYYKTNCGMSDELRIKEFPWQKRTQKRAPAVFNYLGKAKTENQQIES